METPEINEAAELLPQRELTLQRKAFGVFSERRDKFCQALMVRLKGDFCVAEGNALGTRRRKKSALKGVFNRDSFVAIEVPQQGTLVVCDLFQGRCSRLRRFRLTACSRTRGIVLPLWLCLAKRGVIFWARPFCPRRGRSPSRRS